MKNECQLDLRFKLDIQKMLRKNFSSAYDASTQITVQLWASLSFS